MEHITDVRMRGATAADARVLAAHRVAMFRDMGRLRPSLEAPLRDASTAYFTRAVPAGEYTAWLALAGDAVVAGAGVQRRILLPRPDERGESLVLGQEGIVLNVYVEPAWRRQGLARRLMDAILAWAPAAGIRRLVLHPSDEGRRLYERLGFVPTNELRYAGAHDLTTSVPTRP